MPTVKLTIEIEVPEDCAYTSVDFDETISSHTAKPIPINSFKDGLLSNEWVYNGKGDRTIGEIYLYESSRTPILNWRETLTKVK
jgi:hypothetical protein